MNLMLKPISFVMLSLVSSLSWAEGCLEQSARVCIEGPETRNINGVDVYRPCWKFERSFLCRSEEYVDTCQPLQDLGCGQINSTCTKYLESTGQCSLYEQTYQCIDQPGSVSTILDCGEQTYCMDGHCVDASYPPDQDFGNVVSGLEFTRQLGNYMDPDTMTVFNGTSSHCRETFGVFDCCGSDTQASDNGSMLAAGMSTAIDIAGETVTYIGSNYVYDYLYMADTPDYMLDGFASVFGGNSAYDFTFDASFSYMGMVGGYGAYGEVAGTMLLQGGGTSGFYLAFDPTSLAISLGLMIITELASCEQEEQLLSLKKGQNLCVHIGTYCSEDILDICIQEKEGYCCFNSPLAKTVAIEGRKQLDKSWGTAKHPSCGGFTLPEIQSLDFSKMDMSEVIGEIQSSIKLPDLAIDRATTKIKSYY